jgi:thioredoxin-dependent peroxiredoxin
MSISDVIKLLSAAFISLASVLSGKAQDVNLREGDEAPDFTLQTDEGNWVKLSDFKGKANVILYFYPKDMTSGCTKEACHFRDNLSQFKDYNTEVLGVSTDDAASHKAFKEKEGLNFTLLADPDKEVTKKYGVLSLYGLASRVTFVIDKNGIIRKIYDKVDVNENYKELLEYLKTLQL